MPSIGCAVSAIQRDGRVFLTPTVWKGKQAIRCAFDNWATTEADVKILQQTVREMGSKGAKPAHDMKSVHGAQIGRFHDRIETGK